MSFSGYHCVLEVYVVLVYFYTRTRKFSLSFRVQFGLELLRHAVSVITGDSLNMNLIGFLNLQVNKYLWDQKKNVLVWV